jgi:hypothetical protein
MTGTNGFRISFRKMAATIITAARTGTAAHQSHSRYFGLTLPRSSRRRIKPICPHCTSELKFEQGRDGPKADDAVTCYFHGFIGTRAQVDLAVAKRAQTHICDEIKVEIS